jgi:hypothetical protein
LPTKGSLGIRGALLKPVICKTWDRSIQAFYNVVIMAKFDLLVNVKNQQVEMLPISNRHFMTNNLASMFDAERHLSIFNLPGINI